MKNVIALRHGDTWVAVWNLDFKEAEGEAMADRGHREILYIEDGQLCTFVSKEHD